MAGDQRAHRVPTSPSPETPRPSSSSTRAATPPPRQSSHASTPGHDLAPPRLPEPPHPHLAGAAAPPPRPDLAPSPRRPKRPRPLRWSSVGGEDPRVRVRSPPDRLDLELKGGGLDLKLRGGGLYLKLVGTLKGYDQLLNLVLDEAIEFERGPRIDRSEDIQQAVPGFHSTSQLLIGVLTTCSLPQNFGMTWNYLFIITEFGMNCEARVIDVLEAMNSHGWLA
ncbi:hypothetical protein EJB05_40803, partial [Eragrostis curvula]